MKTLHIKAMLGLVFALAIAGCEQSPQGMNPHQGAAPQGAMAAKSGAVPAAQSGIAKQGGGDVRQLFIGKSQPLLTGQAHISILAANSEKQNARVRVKELRRPSAMVFAPDGTLYFITDYESGTENAVMAILPGFTSELVAHSPQYGYAAGESGRIPMYGYLGGLSLSKGGELLTIVNDQDPYQIDLKTGEMSFISFIHPSGKKIIGVVDYGTAGLKSYGEWSFSHIQTDMEGRIVLYNGGIHKWQRYRYGEKIKEISNLLDLPPAAYLVEANPWENIFFTTLGPDGYIYAVEDGKKPRAPDRVIRIGDPGLSSLRKDASRVAIAEFKHGDLTGALAFSPKGDLAVGAKNAIYLISPTPAK